jgi:hypothetical protein
VHEGGDRASSTLIVTAGASAGATHHFGQRTLPPGTDPFRRNRDVELPQRVAARDPRIHPEVVTRLEVHGSTAAATPDDLDVPRPDGIGERQLGRLRAAEHEGGVRHLGCDGDATGRSTEAFDVEERL